VLFRSAHDGVVDAPLVAQADHLRALGFERLAAQALVGERAEVIRLRNQGRINDAVMRRIERDLDLEDARLEI